MQSNFVIPTPKGRKQPPSTPKIKKQNKTKKQNKPKPKRTTQ
jgi:hypothetical protein